ncbi:hypothetical protein E2C01_059415 [Portunus trituberculatus]|uniref:Uncharacterized protein n=1 Tax=Portunus trituberculatus TaxID=210409 RepID=A0A5B7H2H5_PORTR|nr:hypothetical protein [Portunus trituberculatus]
MPSGERGSFISRLKECLHRMRNFGTHASHTVRTDSKIAGHNFLAIAHLFLAALI